MTVFCAAVWSEDGEKRVTLLVLYYVVIMTYDMTTTAAQTKTDTAAQSKQE